MTKLEKRRPWAKWYWGDWRKDARLRRCSFAARGLWGDMLSLMGGECEPFGCLLMEGQPLEAADLVGLLGGSVREVEKLMADLEGKRVFNRVGDDDVPEDVLAILADMPSLPPGAIFSRRMLRDKARDEADRENGRRGGNPGLKGGLTPPVKAQILDARDKIPERKDSPPKPPSQPSLLADASETPTPRQMLADFDQFYRAFPRKVGRGDAERAYSKARKLATPDQLLAGARRYATSRAGEDSKYTKHPATWLNSKGWLDEVPTSSGQPAPADADTGLWAWRLETFHHGQPETDEEQAIRAGYWRPDWGPEPGQPGCLVPAEAIEAYRCRRPPAAAVGAG